MQHDKSRMWKVVEKSKLSGKFRTYYINRHFDRPHTQQSLATGGWLEYEMPCFYGFSAGAAVYTSQGLGILTDEDQDGGCLLAPGQRSYTVLGKAFLQAKISKTILRVFRQELDTPLINLYDVKMTPKTVEAYTLESRDIPDLTFLASHVRKIKGWNESSFTSMSEAAGIEDSNEPVTLAGIVYSPVENFRLQAWEYLAYKFMNAVYFQADSSWKLCDEIKISAAVQAIDERDVGSALAGEFSTCMGGVKAGLSWLGATMNLGYTITDNSHDIVNPWGSYPGFTSIMEEDCDLAGEKAWLIGLAYDFERSGLKGLSAYTNYTNSDSPDTGSRATPDQQEIDFTVDYRFTGKCEGLWIRMRAAFVDNSHSLNQEDYSDYRVIINYDFSVL